MRWIVVGTGVVFSLVSVFTFAQEVPVLETPFYPLKPGNTWVYDAGDQQVTIRVDKVDVLEHKKGDKVEKVNAHRLVVTKGDRETAEYVAVMADGVYRFAGDGKDLSPPLRFFKLPLKKGEPWEVSATCDGVTVKGTFVADEEEVTVPAGKFTTMTATANDLQVGSQKMSVKYWFAPNVGIVKQWIKLPGQEVTMQLKKFTPAAK